MISRRNGPGKKWPESLDDLEVEVRGGASGRIARLLGLLLELIRHVRCFSLNMQYPNRCP